MIILFHRINYKLKLNIVFVFFLFISISLIEIEEIYIYTLKKFLFLIIRLMKVIHVGMTEETHRLLSGTSQLLNQLLFTFVVQVYQVY